jgi:hypothetical protein
MFPVVVISREGEKNKMGPSPFCPNSQTVSADDIANAEIIRLEYNAQMSKDLETYRSSGQDTDVAIRQFLGSAKPIPESKEKTKIYSQPHKKHKYSQLREQIQKKTTPNVSIQKKSPPAVSVSADDPELAKVIQSLTKETPSDGKEGPLSQLINEYERRLNSKSQKSNKT